MLGVETRSRKGRLTDLIDAGPGRLDRAIPSHCSCRAVACTVAAAVCTCIASQAQAQQNTAPDCTCSVDVHVVDALDHTAVSYAVVSAKNSADFSDERGHVLLGQLCPGPLEISVEHPSYAVVNRSVVLDDQCANRSKPRTLEFELAFEVAPEDEIVVEDEAEVATQQMQSTAVLSGKALERMRGRSLSETLKELPGVAQMRNGTGAAKPIVRGHFGRRVPMLVDGVRHRSQDWGIDHAPEIEPAMAGRIAVVRGASGVRYGSDAVGGVLLVDAPPLPTQPGFKSEAHLLGYANGLGLGGFGRVGWMPQALPGFSLQLDGGGKRVASASTPDYALDNTGEEELAGGIAAGYTTGTASYRLSFRRFVSKIGICSCFRVGSADDFFAQLNRRRPLGVEVYRADAEIERPFQSVVHNLGVARGQWWFDGYGVLTATYAFQSDFRREYDIVRQATRGPQLLFDLYTHDADVAFDHYPVHLAENLHVTGTAGVSAMLQIHRFSGLPLVPSHDAVGAGLFAIERLWGHDWEIEGGLRYDFLTREAAFGRRDFLGLVRSGQLERDACGTFSATEPDVNCRSFFHTLSANLGGHYRLSEAWSGKLDLAVASRAPNPDEQYLNGTAPSLPVFALGKPDAGPETSYNATLTVSYSAPGISAEVSGYGNYIDDYLYFAPVFNDNGDPFFDVLIRGTFPRFATQPIDALFYGADGSVAVDIFPWLEVQSQLSMVRAQNADDGTFLLFIPADRARVAATAKREGKVAGFEGLSAAVAATAVARQTRFETAADLSDPPPGYVVADAEFMAERRFDQLTVKAALYVSNAFGARYREYTSLLRYFADQPGRQAMLRLTFQHEALN